MTLKGIPHKNVKVALYYIHRKAARKAWNPESYTPEREVSAVGYKQGGKTVANAKFYKDGSAFSNTNWYRSTIRANAVLFYDRTTGKVLSRCLYTKPIRTRKGTFTVQVIATLTEESL